MDAALWSINERLGALCEAHEVHNVGYRLTEPSRRWMWELLAATAKEFKTIYPDLDDDDRDPMKPRFERVNRIG